MNIYKKISFNLRKLINSELYLGTDNKNPTKIFYLKQNLNLKELETYKGIAIYKNCEYEIVLKDTEKSFFGFHPVNGNIIRKSNVIANITIHTVNEYTKKDKKCCVITLKDGDSVTLHKESEDVNNTIYLMKCNGVTIVKTIEYASILERIKDIYLGYFREAVLTDYNKFKNLSIETQCALFCALAFWPFFCNRFESQFTPS
jgi:hypothetical protein